MKKQIRILRGYIYPCYDYECQGTIISPIKLTKENLKRSFRDWEKRLGKTEEEAEKIAEAIMEEYEKEIKQEEEEHEIYCSIGTPCVILESINVVEINKFLRQYAGKRIWILIAEEGGGH